MKLIRFEHEQISHVVANGNYTWLFYGNGNSFLSCKTLLHFERMWPHFVRIHRHVLVNPAYVKRMSRPDAKKVTVTMKSKTRFSVARRRVVRVSLKLSKSPASVTATTE